MLCDFDSCTWRKAKHTSKLTPQFVPRGLNRTVSRRFDNVLLAVSAIVLIDPSKIKLGDFSMSDLQSAVEDAAEAVPILRELLN